MLRRAGIYSILFFYLAAHPAASQEEKHFKLLTPEESGINFQNKITENKQWNIFRYMNIYNGGGVAVGDLNNDGLPDVFFVGNQVNNKLYLNKGNLKFEDVTAKAGLEGPGGWCSGVVMVDVNGDSWLDIYVCRAGLYDDTTAARANLLYINNGDLTFTEMGAKYGIADQGRSVQATFLDYDGDNDLDLYVVNHPQDFNAPLQRRVESEKRLPDGETDRLYRNNGAGKFEDVTDEAGVRNWGFGLSCLATDFDNQAGPDVYVGVDYSERDNFWVNTGNGRFEEGLFKSFMHIPNFSMGSDAGDINNDGWPDMMVVDMVAEDNRRKKTNMSGMNPKAFWDNVDKGRHYQYMQNALQLNNGNGTFSDIAEMAGVAYTDWSWSPLFGDLDNDGWQDIVVTNGLRRDVRNSDFAKGLLNSSLGRLYANYEVYERKIPVERIPNYAFKNNGDLTFSKVAKEWGLDWSGFSNGMCLSDLDRDGDLDIVMNNLEDNSFIYENTQSSGNYLLLEFEGPGLNSKGIGVKVRCETNAGTIYRELTTSRGFLSGSEPAIHLGLGAEKEIAELQVEWPDGSVESMENVVVNQKMLVKYQAGLPKRNEGDPPVLLSNVVKNSGIDFQHKDWAFDDYKDQVLLPHKYSQNGPFMAIGDADGDGSEDLFVGGAAGQSGILYLQRSAGRFTAATEQPWGQHKQSEDIGALFFDSDGDGDQDLYVTSGSNEWGSKDSVYQDRLYVNKGNGVFEYAPEALPDLRTSGSRLSAADFDGDGDLDICVGGRVVPGDYPSPAPTALLRNKKGKFTDVSSDLLPALATAGLITDVEWIDYDNDKDPDLIIAGEWTSIRVFENHKGKFTEKTKEVGLSGHTGWWYSLTPCDPDNDGDIDLVAGNLGQNAKHQATLEEPFQVYYQDFDMNGTKDIVLGYYNDGVAYPVRGRECSSQQVPAIKQKFPTYKDFSIASLEDVYGTGIKDEIHYEANWFYTSYIENQGDGSYKVHALPNEAQLSTVQSSVVVDVTGDGVDDIIVLGNLLHAEVETCRHDASIGMVLQGDGKGHFSARHPSKSGLFAHGDVKDAGLIRLQDGNAWIVFTRNNGGLGAYRIDAFQK